MVAKLATVVRITARANKVWRECDRCASLAPMAGTETRCPSCRTSATTPRRISRRRAA